MRRPFVALLGTTTLLAGCAKSAVLPPGCATTPGGAGTSVSSIACPVTPTTNGALAFDSSPRGLAISANGTTQAVTPFTATPAFSVGAVSYAIHPSNGATAFAYIFQQTNDGNRTLYYNQSADTSGSIASIAPAAEARSNDALAFAPDVFVRRSFTPIADRPLVSSTRLAVFYRASALQASGRTVVDVERAAAVSSAVTLGLVLNDRITRIVAVPAGETAADLAAKFSADSAVSGVAPLHFRYTLSATPFTPSDPYFNRQWDFQRIGVPYAWGYTHGTSTTAIAIVDTGLDVTQGDFGAGKVTYAEKIVNGSVTFGDAAAQDLDGHGTNVAGIAAAQTNNGFGYAGVGYNVSLQAYRVFPDPVPPLYASASTYASNTADEAQAIYDAVARGARVINVSLGAPAVGASGESGFDDVEHSAIEYAIAQGVTVVAAAGNDASGTLDFPAGYEGVISVGASALSDGNPSSTPTYSSSIPEEVASYSNDGPDLSLVAPGGAPTGNTDPDLLHWIGNAFSTAAADPAYQCSNRGNCIAYLAGTSQATPHVAGTAALMLSVNPALKPAQIARILESTADDIRDSRQGHGRLNAYRALAAVEGDTAPSAPTNLNFVAFAYVPNGGDKLDILDVTYPSGVPVASNGTFRIADIQPNAPAYKIGVWYDANGDGLVDQGDWFGSTAGSCTASAPCAAASGIVARPVTSGFTL